MIVNQFKTLLLLGGLGAILVLIGGLVSPGLVWLFGGIAVAMNVGAYFFSHRIVLRMNRAREVSPSEEPYLHQMVEDLANSAGIPKPRVYLVDDPAPNAFATGRNPKNGVVAVTTGIREILTERELRGVLAHEMAHIKNRDILVATIAATIAAVVAIIASVVKWGAIFGGFGGRDDDDGGGNIIAMIALAIVAPIAATVIQLAISRSREYGADAVGARIADDPLALASALGKLERGNKRVRFHAVGDNPATASLFICSPLTGRGVSKWFSTHPPIAERIKRLEEMAA